MLTKEECRESLSDLYNVLCNRLNEEMQDYRQDFDRLGKLIEEHFDNPPLTVADIPLEEEIMCWDNVEKEWCSIYSEGGEISIAYIMLPTKYTLYETFDIKHNNRFYRKEVVQND